ncbi:MAG TPA: hypothetical protein DCM31_07820 [Deferribacteraceae bacterium]|jgi:hypothetical protein|nr:hypothetical protein [Deferribacteraceae bacterium]
MKQPVWKKWVEKERKEVKLTFTFALKHADDKELIALLKSVPRRRRGQVIRYLLLQGLKAEDITKNSKDNTPEQPEQQQPIPASTATDIPAEKINRLFGDMDL